MRRLQRLLAFIGRHRVAVARLLAVVVDIVQVGFPLFVGGVTSPLNDALDVLAAAALLALLGWHWAFLPALGLESLPAVVFSHAPGRRQPRHLELPE